MSEKICRFDFYKNRKIYYIISAAIILVGIIGSIIVGPKLDIQFAGGAMIRYSVTGGEVDGPSIEDTLSSKLNMDSSVTVNQAINSEGKSVTVSFAGNQGITPDEQEKVAEALTEAYEELTFTLMESSSVDATMGARFLQKCLVCFVITAVLLLLYITFRFRKVGGFAAGLTAIIALLHDIVILACVYIIFGMSINDIFIAVILTILGYSLNSTIVNYDRIRENRRKMGPKSSYIDVVNLSLNQTLSRTIITSVATFLAVLVVFIVALIFNINTVVAFALPMLAGIAAGCFSSQCIAPIIYLSWKLRQQEKDTKKKK